MKKLVILFAGFILAACAAGGVSLVDQEQLSLPKENKEFVLDAPISVTQLYGAVNAKQLEGLLPGKYSAFRQDNEGTYYLGSGKSIFLQHESQNTKSYYKGGVWVPNNPNKNIRMFVFYSTKGDKLDYSFGPVVDFIVKQDIGKMNVHQEVTDSSFNNAIKKLLNK